MNRKKRQVKAVEVDKRCAKLKGRREQKEMKLGQCDGREGRLTEEKLGSWQGGQEPRDQPTINLFNETKQRESPFWTSHNCFQSQW